MGAKPIPDYHQKPMKPPQPDFPVNRSSTHSQPQPPQPQPHKKQPSWAQQQPGVVNQQKSAQSHTQSSQSQPNLSSSSSSSSGNSNSINRNMPTSLPSYNESTKQSTSAQPVANNDYWFNDKIQDATAKVASPPRPTKSMFSPSPEHDAFDRTKLMMMQAANAKRNDSPKSDKSDRRSSTPIKREKRPELSTTPNASQKVPQQKLLVPKLENAASAPQLMPDQSKKRPFSSVEDGDQSRDSKSRKMDPGIKTEPSSLVSGAMKQPIETNPDIVKSLLKECYTVNSKFDSYGMDSPLDVINPEPTNQTVPSMMATSSFPPQVKMETDLLSIKDEPQDNGFGDDHARKKSKKERKKDKHKHKKNKKSHKSDKSDREDRKDSLKIILSHKSDSPSEGMHTGGLKIKIPIKDVNKTDLPPAGSSLPTAPLKLKISKEKIGGFNNSTQNLSDGGSSSSSSHKKKDKDRSKSKSSKHGNNNNNSDYKDAGYQQQPPQQQQPMNKVSPPPVHSAWLAS